jgi:hypothetical protein
MKKFYLSLFLLTYLSASAQQWQWAYSITSDADAWLQNTHADSTGNAYILMQPAIGPVTFHAANDSIVLTGGSTYIAQYDSAGSIQWISGGNSHVVASDFTVDAAGNSYVSGDFDSTASFGTAGDSLQQTASYSSDAMLVRLAATGHPAFFIHWGDTCYDSSHNATLNGTNAIVITHDDTVCSQFNAQGISTIDKYDINGSLLWSLPLPGDESFVYTVETTGGGYLISSIYNHYDDTTVHGMSNSMSLPFCTDQAWTYLIKYSAAGNVEWVTTAQSSFAFPTAVASDNSGNIFISIITMDTLHYDSQTFPPLTSYTIHLLKLDANGHLLQHMSFPNNGTTGFRFYDINCDAQNNVYLLAKVSSSLTIDSVTLTFNMPHGAAVAVIKLDDMLHYIWSQYVSVGLNDGGTMAVTPSEVYIGVHYETDVSLNNSPYSFPGPNFPARHSFIGAINNGSVSTGISDNHVISLSIFPNPNNGSFTIQTSKPTELKIYNSFGQLIHQQIINGSTGSPIQESTIINLSSQAKGIYFLEAGGERRKIVVE